MTIDLAMVLALLAAAVVMFALGRPRMDAVALLMLALLPLTGVITMNEALAGFSDANVVLIALLFVIGEGLVRTGVAQRLGDWLVARAGSSETRLLVLLMAGRGGPGRGDELDRRGRDLHPDRAADRPEHRHRAQPADDAAERRRPDQRHDDPGRDRAQPRRRCRAAAQRASGFEFFSFTPFGCRSWRWASSTCCSPAAGFRPRSTRGGGRAGRACATGSRSTGSPGASAGCGSRRLAAGRADARGAAAARQSGAQLLAIEREGRFAPEIVRPVATTRLRAGDVLLIDLFVPDTNAEELARELGLELLPLSGAYFADRAQEVGMVEVMLPEGSGVVGRTLVRSEFRTRYDVTAVGLRRGNQARCNNITRRGAAGRRHPAGGRFLVRHPQAADLPPRHDRARPAGRAGRGAAGGQPGAAGAALPAAGRRADGQRRRAQRPGGADRLPADGRAAAASTSPAPTARSTGRA